MKCSGQTSKTPLSHNRRLFLQQLLASGAALASTSLLPSQLSHAQVSMPKTLVNVMLFGGADFRFVFAPHPTLSDPVYVNQYWLARRSLQGGYGDYVSMYAAEYTSVTDAGRALSFGIHNSCGWLISQFNAGNATIIANTFGSLNRRHDHSQLIVESGDLLASRTFIDRDGWGGRLSESLSGQPNVIELGSNVQTFCKGTTATYRLAQVVHAQNTRNMGLPQISGSGTTSDDKLIRALAAYYVARGTEIETEKPASWPYRKFFQHHTSISEFGDAMAARLSSTPLPSALVNWSGNSVFRQQCRNLFDASLAPDILNYRLLSMSYGGWDTHTNQNASITGRLNDILGATGGLATAQNELTTNAKNNLVYHFSWDFGRQLAANGSDGTDHGRANYTILIGNPLAGGTHGELFPSYEALPDAGDSLGRTPFEIPGRDIKGLTSLERIWAAHSNWLQAGTSATVFPGASSSLIEAGVNLGSLYT